MSEKRVRIVRGPRAAAACRLFGEVGKATEEGLPDAETRGFEVGLARALEEFAFAETSRRTRLHEAERELLDLAFGIAERVVAAKIDREQFQHIVDEQLAAVRGAPEILLRVCPSAVEQIYFEPLDGVVIVVEADPTLAEGDCIIETDRGNVDARVAVRLDTLRRALEGR